jgi:16S rRNA processing protein RimM
MDTQKSTMLVGNIAGAYGVKGWLKVTSYTDPLENIFKYSPWRLVSLRDGKAPREVKLVHGKLHGKGLVVQLEGIDDRDGAESLKGLGIYVERERVPDPDSGHFYWADLEGLQVETTTGTVLGRVDHLIDTGSADVMVVCGEKRHLVPFIFGDTVLNVDLEAGCIQVDWEVVRIEHG